jgi:hypothetical protein
VFSSESKVVGAGGTREQAKLKRQCDDLGLTNKVTPSIRSLNEQLVSD